MPAESIFIHPDHRNWLAELHLTNAASIIGLAGDVVSGHPDRHVVRVTLGRGSKRIVAYLKREHRIPWRDRPMNAWAGFGWVTKSEREAITLLAMAESGLPVPQVIAFGEDGVGQAFLLVRAVRGVELSKFLTDFDVSSSQRSALAVRVGELIAKVHRAGFDLPDLSTKHLLVDPDDLQLSIIDVPRTCRRGRISRSARLHDLARLHSSCTVFATKRERHTALRAYLGSRNHARGWIADIDRIARLMAHRHVADRAQHNAGPKVRLRWVDGERLVMTRSFWRRCKGNPPDWLTLAARTVVSKPRRSNVYFDGRVIALWQTPPTPLWRRFVARMTGRASPSEPVRLAGLHNRLTMHGIAAPRLVAFGRQADGAGFRLACPIQNTLPFASWLHRPHRRRTTLLREAGDVLRRLHGAGLRLDGYPFALHVHRPLSPRPHIVLADVRSLTKLPRSAGRIPLMDLARFMRSLELTEHEALHVVRGYLGSECDRRQCRDLLMDLRAGLPPRGGQVA